jgi:hypothetical protein
MNFHLGKSMNCPMRLGLSETTCPQRLREQNPVKVVFVFYDSEPSRSCSRLCPLFLLVLASYYEAPGARQVERYIKNAQFSLATAPSPSPTTNKRRKFNASGAPAPPRYVQPQMRLVPMGRAGHLHGARRRGRGGYNRNFRPSHTDQRRMHDVDNRRPTDQRNREHETQVPHVPGQSPARKMQGGMPEEVTIIESTPPTAATTAHASAPLASGSSSVSIKPWSPIMERVLDWNDL